MSNTEAGRPDSGWRTEITRMQWLVLLGTTMGWALDGFAGSLYALVLGPAMTELLPHSGIVANASGIGLYGGLTVALFLAGWAAGGILFGVLAWASMLWPGLSVTDEHLELRTMVEHQSLPLAAIESIAVGQVLVVRAGEKRYVSTAIGKPWRKAVVSGRRDKAESPAVDTDTAPGEVPYADWVENEIRERMDHAREVTGVRLLSDEQLALAGGVRRRPAWLPIVLLGGSVLAFAVSVLL